ncbi:MAG TPA: hypothetical protein VKV73_13420 [Chloroflexota bacterium]|nr:hypothetical protein [Chloroflexota bacterium]
MREHLTELLPLVLVGVVLLVFQLSRDSGQVLHFLPLPDQPFAAPAPTPQTALPPIAVSTKPTPPASPAPEAGGCTASRPTFVGGMAALRASLGTGMGEPLECERAVDDQGDTQQKTTTGLAYYRSHVNVASFTTGWDHWGLKEGALVHWTGDPIDPPSDAAPSAQ